METNGHIINSIPNNNVMDLIDFMIKLEESRQQSLIRVQLLC